MSRSFAEEMRIPVRRGKYYLPEQGTMNITMADVKVTIDGAMLFEDSIMVVDVPFCDPLSGLTGDLAIDLSVLDSIGSISFDPFDNEVIFEWKPEE